MLEDVAEPVYRIDRALAQVTAWAKANGALGLRLGRCSAIVPNDPDFGREPEAVAAEWCERTGLPWLGFADIGHDAENKVVRSERASYTGRTAGISARASPCAPLHPRFAAVPIPGAAGEERETRHAPHTLQASALCSTPPAGEVELYQRDALRPDAFRTASRAGRVKVAAQAAPRQGSP
jgi:hypothetical protein